MTEPTHAFTPPTPNTVAAPVVPSRSTLDPLGVLDVDFEGGFWGALQSLNATTMIQHCEYWMERLGWIGNFDAAVEGRLPADRRGREFSDSDVYKLLEAMAWEIGRTGDAGLESRYRAIVGRIAPVQEADGYLNTMFGRPGQGARYSDLEWGHELYCYGHLLQAAVARGRTAGQDELLQIARRAADHVCEVFGPGGIESVDGHAEIEPALVEFARYTGDRRYLDQARLFLERRGTHVLDDIEFGREYYQDDQTIREAEVLRGHAVRATYLAAGAIDAAVEDDDRELLESVERQLGRTVARRTYLTGGMGAHHEGESFGSDWELPSERAYSETCAGVGSVMAHHRLLLATGEARYGDIIERTLYNVIATSPAEDGKSFFYTNTLHRPTPGRVPQVDEVSPRAAASLRAPWFAVSCCPTNVARTVASLGAYVAAIGNDTLHVVQYAAGRIRAELPAGAIELTVETAYPNDGRITLRVVAAPADGARVALRVPGWAGEDSRLTGGGETRAVGAGWAAVDAVHTGDELVLELPVQARITRPDPRIDALRGQVAVERGPLVYCVERLADDPEQVDALRVAGEPIDDVNGVRLPMIPFGFDDAEWPFSSTPGARPAGGAIDVPLIPYHRWGNRGPSTMRVWMPTAEEAVRSAG